MSAATVHTFAPAGRVPQNTAELHALMEERNRAAGLVPAATVVPAAPVQRRQETVVVRPVTALIPAPTTPDTPPPDETEARARLADAIRVRDRARQDVDGAETAVARAKRLEAEAEGRAAVTITTELAGAGDLAARIAAWSAAGGVGEAPDLVLDPEAVAARQEGDKARVAADAARTAARQLEAALGDRRAVLAAAEAEVTAAKREVAAAIVEAIAIRGAEAERVHHRARLASSVVDDLLKASPTAYLPAVPPVAAKLRNPEITSLSGSRQEHVAAWQDLLRRLDADPNAAL